MLDMQADGDFSQEIENSSNSTRNSRDMKILKKLILESDEKLRFFRNAKNSKESKSIFESVNKANNAEKKTSVNFSRLPLVEKKDYIENWIRSNEANFLENSPKKSSPRSPVSPKKQEKRFAASPLSSCDGKRRRSQNFQWTDNSTSKTKENLEFEQNDHVIDETQLERSSVEFRRNSSASHSVNGSRQIFQPRTCPEDSKCVIWNGRNSEILAPSSPIVVDSKIARFSWTEKNGVDRKFLKSRQHWREKIGRPSASKFREGSPLRWTGYESPSVGSEFEKHEKGQERSFSRNLCLLRESNWRKLSPESPLRWTGYEILDSSPSSSLVIRTDRGEGCSSPKGIICSSTSSRTSIRTVNKILAGSESESPLRWIGYEPQIRDVQKLAPSQTLSSPINEAERIIDPSSSSESDEVLILEDENSSGEKNSRKSRRRGKKWNFQAETPQRWGGSKIPDVSLSTNDVELASLIEASPGFEETVVESQKSWRNIRLTRKSRPVKLETIFGSQTERIPVPSCPDLPETRAVSLAMPETEKIEVESLGVSVAEEESKIDVESETGSDRTIGNNIDDVLTQNPSPKSPRSFNFVDEEKTDISPRNIDQEESDSDKTYFSDGEPDRNTIRADNSLQQSQIARNLSHLSRNKSDLISQAASPKLNNEEITISVPTIPPPRNTSKRAKKAKQGSLAARLRYLVNFQISDRQIWRYRKSRADWQESRAQFVKLRIREGEIKYSRCFLLASLIEDEYKLLNDLWASVKERVEDKEAITLMIVPEINGTMKISKNSIMKIYPPWKIMDGDKKILNIIYFEVLAQDDECTFEPSRSIEAEKIIQTFDCPCLQNRAIDHSCNVKFTNNKPNVIRQMFPESK